MLMVQILNKVPSLSELQTTTDDLRVYTLLNYGAYWTSTDCIVHTKIICANLKSDITSVGIVYLINSF